MREFEDIRQNSRKTNQSICGCGFISKASGRYSKIAIKWTFFFAIDTSCQYGIFALCFYVEIFFLLSVLFVNSCLSLFRFWQSKKSKVLQTKARLSLFELMLSVADFVWNKKAKTKWLCYSLIKFDNWERNRRKHWKLQ